MATIHTTDQVSFVATSVKQPAHVSKVAEHSVNNQQTVNQTNGLDFGNDTLFEDFGDVDLNNEKKINLHELQLTTGYDFDDEKDNSLLRMWSEDTSQARYCEVSQFLVLDET
ncbi:hypothetical protein GQX74_011078 [Glossina fuscipes]|nr:hypothetical protein GQX74_011078 [Glossina fuscipes]